MTEKFPSCTVDGSQGTVFVLQDNSQSLDLFEMVIVDPAAGRGDWRDTQMSL